MPQENKKITPKQKSYGKQKSSGKIKIWRQNGKSGGKIKKHVVTQSLEFYPRIFRNI